MIANDECLPSMNTLSTDVVANILSYLDDPMEFMRARVNRKIRDAATTTIVAATFEIYNIRRYNALIAMRRAVPNAVGEVKRALPNLLRIEIENLRIDFKELSYFKMLRSLYLFRSRAPRTLENNSSYLFNFKFLQELTILGCHRLKWDLTSVSGLPSLEKLNCEKNDRLSGNIISLRVLRHSLEQVIIANCPCVEGNLMDIADLQRLKILHLVKTQVVGDVRLITENDFPSLKEASFPTGVYGGSGFRFQSISEAVAFANSPHVYRLLKRSPKIFPSCLMISCSSPDWYDELDEIFPMTPMGFEFVNAGSRIGWRWRGCEINWLDPEPSETDSSEYEVYSHELSRLQCADVLYAGCYQPPTQEVYWQLCNIHRDFYLARAAALMDFDDSSFGTYYDFTRLDVNIL